MSDTTTWDAPIPLGQRLCWRWNDENLSIPVLSVTPIYTDERGDDPMKYGYHADLPTENGATISLLYDPEHAPEQPFDESKVSIWLYVKHPEYGHRIGARLLRNADANYSITYDPRCMGETCTACEHDAKQWWEYVHDGPVHVMQRLRWLGVLPIKVPVR